MIRILLAAVLTLTATTAFGQVRSEYTRYDANTDCTMIDAAREEGDWADLVCPGFGGYPFVIRATDGRESVTYGFATDSGMRTFGPFNYANGTVEWRIAVERAIARPFAAIQRWYIADTNGEWARQLLVVSRVGQPDGGGACPVAYVATTEGANERAREYADSLAPDFICGSDTPTVEDGVIDIVGPLD